MKGKEIAEKEKMKELEEGVIPGWEAEKGWFGEYAQNMIRRIIEVVNVFDKF